MNIPTWITIVGMVFGAIGTAGIGGLMKTWLDHLRGKRKQSDEVAMNLVELLTQRVTTVEAQSAHERALCDANLSVLRHRLNNLSMSFNGLLTVMEIAPDKAAEYIVRLKEQRAQQEQSEAHEKAAVQAAVVAASPRPSVEAADPKRD